MFGMFLQWFLELVLPRAPDVSPEASRSTQTGTLQRLSLSDSLFTHALFLNWLARPGRGDNSSCRMSLTLARVSSDNGYKKNQLLWELFWKAVIRGKRELARLHQNGHVCWREPVFGHVAGALGSMSSRAMNQIQILTAAVDTEADPMSGHGAGGAVAFWDDLIQLLGTPYFPPTSQRWLLSFFFFFLTRTKPNKAL